MSEIEGKAIRRICKNKNSPSRRVYITLAIVVVSVALVGVIIRVLRMHGPPRASNRLLCGSNLSSLGAALRMFTIDYDGQYPKADNWCDLLIMNYEVRLELLVCRGSDATKGESSYAINKNIAGKKPSEIPSDTVLLFETNLGKNPSGRDGILGDRQWYKSLSSLSDSWDLKTYKHSEKVYELRWNQVGGLDMLTTVNHEGKGCWVLFNDMHGEFVRAERLGELKWVTEKKDSEPVE